MGSTDFTLRPRSHSKTSSAQPAPDTAHHGGAVTAEFRLQGGVALGVEGASVVQHPPGFGLSGDAVSVRSTLSLSLEAARHSARPASTGGSSSGARSFHGASSSRKC